MTQLVTGDTAPGDTEARQVRQRGTPEGAAHVYIKGIDGEGITIENVDVNPASDYDTDGDPLPNGLPETYGYSDGQLTTITRTDGVNTWVKTLSYSDGQLMGDSGWVKQEA